jgi:hypothetical protein
MKKTLPNNLFVFLVALMIMPILSAHGVETSFTGGRVKENLSLTKANGPYLISSTIEIPTGVTLTIEPGVQIKVDSPVNLFWIQGKLSIQGTLDLPVRIDGAASSYFYLKGARTAEVNAKFLFVNGSGIGSVIPATGHEQNASLNFEDCEFVNIPGFNYIWYPNAARISRNVFWKTAGFSIGTNNAEVSFRNNLFLGDPIKVEENSYWLDVWNGSTLVNLSGNEFRDLTKNALVGKVSFSAKGNYWTGIDPSAVNRHILDSNDSLNFPGVVDFSGQLTLPPVEVPKNSSLVKEFQTKEAEAKVAAELKAQQEADAKAARELAAAKQKEKEEAEARSAVEKAAAEQKAKLEEQAKAAAELKVKEEAERKATAESIAAYNIIVEKNAAEVKAKQDADAKAAAEKVLADAKAQAAKIIADAKAKAMKKISITCIKGKLTKKVTSVNPKCPAGYKKK